VNSDDLIGLVAVVLLFGGGTLCLLAISPVGKAFAARIGGKKGVVEGDETIEEVKELRRDVEEMRHLGEQMSELGERVDFLERLVAKQREAERLPPAR
jgi:chromosome condensin MukBEF ATPase and DNA-binding subunit MukB